jgi:hypothetical protein
MVEDAIWERDDRRKATAAKREQAASDSSFDIELERFERRQPIAGSAAVSLCNHRYLDRRALLDTGRLNISCCVTQYYLYF